VHYTSEVPEAARDGGKTFQYGIVQQSASNGCVAQAGRTYCDLFSLALK